MGRFWLAGLVILTACNSPVTEVDEPEVSTSSSTTVSSAMSPTTRSGGGTRAANGIPVYRAAEELVSVLNESAFACPGVDVYSVEAVAPMSADGVVGVAECREGGANHPEVDGYTAIVFDSVENRRLSLIGMLAFGCMQPRVSYAYGPNWLVLPWDGDEAHEALEELAGVLSGHAAAVDCELFWASPEGTSADMNPADLDVAWFLEATGEVEFASLSAHELPNVPSLPAATWTVEAPNDGVVVDGLLVAVGGGTRLRWALPDPLAILIEHQFGADDLDRIVAIDGGFVATGSSGKTVGRSSDGINWVYVDLPDVVGADSIASGPGGLLVVGHGEGGPMIWQSDNGISWQPYRPPERTGTPLEGLIDANDRQQRIEHVAANERGYVVVNNGGGKARAWYSEDLISWSQAHDFDATVADIIVHQERFVVLTRGDGVGVGLWIAEDGREWRQVAESIDLGLSHPGLYKRALASSGSGMLALTVNGAVAVSPDGISWTPVTAPVGLDGISVPTVVGGPDGWYIFAEIDRGAWGIFASRDGETWKRVEAE